MAQVKCKSNAVLARCRSLMAHFHASCTSALRSCGMHLALGGWRLWKSSTWWGFQWNSMSLMRLDAKPSSQRVPSAMRMPSSGIPWLFQTQRLQFWHCCSVSNCLGLSFQAGMLQVYVVFARRDSFRCEVYRFKTKMVQVIVGLASALSGTDLSHESPGLWRKESQRNHLPRAWLRVHCNPIFCNMGFRTQCIAIIVTCHGRTALKWVLASNPASHVELRSQKISSKIMPRCWRRSPFSPPFSWLSWLLYMHHEIQTCCNCVENCAYAICHTVKIL